MNSSDIKNDFLKNFTVVYNNLYKLHPQSNEDDFRLRYLRVDWFFPNHIHNVLIQIKEMNGKYFNNLDLEVCLFAGLLHDSGLVYKRELPSPSGHENRSVEYASKELRSLGYNDNFIANVIECIKSTEPDYNSPLQEAILVRNADAYAHIISMHFFAKANFNSDIHSFINWFEKKIKSTYSKISIRQIQEEIQPLFNFYTKMITNYRDNKDETAFFQRLFR